MKTDLAVGSLVPNPLGDQRRIFCQRELAFSHQPDCRHRSGLAAWTAALAGAAGPSTWIVVGACHPVTPIEIGPAPITRRGQGDLVSDDSLRPRDHAEAIALFRAEVIGALAHREFLRLPRPG